MRKMLAGFLATSMIVTIASSVTFAANTAASATFALAPITIAAPGAGAYSGDDYTGAYTRWDILPASDNVVDSTTATYTCDLGTATITLYKLGKTVGSYPFKPTELTAPTTLTLKNGASTPTAIVYVSGTPVTFTADQVAGTLAGQKFSHFDIGGKLFSGELTKVALGGGRTGLGIQFKDAAQMPDFDAIELDFTGSTVSMNPSKLGYNFPGDASKSGTLSFTTGAVTMTSNYIGTIVSKGTGDNTANISGNLNVEDVIVCDGEGNPIPLTEDPSGVDQAINDVDGVQSGTTVYFMIKEKLPDNVTKSFYDDDNYYKIRVNKGDNAKMIKSLDVVYKNFSKDLYDVVQGTSDDTVAGTKGRHRLIKVELNPNYTTDEFKITLDMRLTPTASAVDKGIANSDDELKIKDFSFYMKNIERTADNDWRVGINGLMLKPMENDWNDVTWFDEDGDVAHMKFFADSDISSFYSKLSTKWEHTDYASYFNDQDAYIFNFTGSPKLSATSRADLEIYNPFVDEDGNETIDPSTAVIYQIIDGDLFDVTSSFEYKEAESGDMAWTTRTRFLGTYVICEKKVEEAVDNTEAPDELIPDTDTTPSEVTPDNNNGGKAPANTGKYL